MRFLVDAQLPPSLADWLIARGFEAKAVRDLGLREASDAAIWSMANKTGWVVVSKDEDFVDFALKYASGPQVVWVRVGNCTNPVFFTGLASVWDEVVRLLQSKEKIVELRFSI